MAIIEEKRQRLRQEDERFVHCVLPVPAPIESPETKRQDDDGYQDSGDARHEGRKEGRTMVHPALEPGSQILESKSYQKR